jgi:hypothetical protein
MDNNERSGLCVRMVREMDPYAVPVTSIGGHNRLPTGYANKSFQTCLTAGAARGLSGAGTSGSPRDMPKIVSVSGVDAATGPDGSSVGLDADLSSDDNSRWIQLVSGGGPAGPGAELLPERAAAFAPLVSPPPLAPAGRPVLCRLPGRFPPTHSAAGTTAAKHRIVPCRSEPSVLVRIVPGWGGHSVCPPSSGTNCRLGPRGRAGGGQREPQTSARSR